MVLSTCDQGDGRVDHVDIRGGQNGVEFIEGSRVRR